MQTSLLPNKVCDKIDSICRSFLWGSTTATQKLHLVSWSNVCQPKSAGGLGLRPARVVNSTFLSKLGWGLIHKRDELWVQVLRSKYKCGTDLIPQVQRHANCSNLWKGICSTWPVVQDNLIWRLGNGNSVSFWQDKWIPSCSRLRDHLLQSVPAHLVNVKVKDLVLNSGGWDWNSFQHLLPSRICSLIASFPPPSQQASADSLVWEPSGDGDFSVKSAYEKIAQWKFATSDPLFNSIWNWHGLERIKLFLWLATHNSLHTNVFRVFRHMASSSFCSRCNEDLDESILHALRDCSVLGDFWRMILPEDKWPTFFNENLYTWLLDDLQNRELVNGHIWNQVFASAAHFLWRIRNEDMFQHSTPCDVDLVQRFWLCFNRIKLHESLVNNVSTPQRKHLSYISWQSPPETWLKVNSDGSVLSSGGAACGGVMRDAAGHFIRAFSANIGHCPVVVAELWGAMHALELAWALDFHQIILEMDSSSAISLLHSCNRSNHPYSSLIDKVKQIIDRNWTVRIVHVYREANRAADLMASKGHSLSLGLHVYCIPPMDLKAVLDEDCRGVALPRLIS